MGVRWHSQQANPASLPKRTEDSSQCLMDPDPSPQAEGSQAGDQEMIPSRAYLL
jgi:hypothetical protein